MTRNTMTVNTVFAMENRHQWKPTMPDNDRQPPILTTAHVQAMRNVVRLFGFPGEADHRHLSDILAHLECLIQEPVLTTAAPAVVDPDCGECTD